MHVYVSILPQTLLPSRLLTAANSLNGYPKPPPLLLRPSYYKFLKLSEVQIAP